MANKERKSELDVFVSDLTGKHAKRMNAVLCTMDDEDFTVAYFKALEYAAPKLQRSEIINENVDQKIEIIHVYKEDID